MDNQQRMKTITSIIFLILFISIVQRVKARDSLPIILRQTGGLRYGLQKQERYHSSNYDDLSNGLEIDPPLVDSDSNRWEIRAKRYLCSRQHFIYNPVSGKCQPTLLAMRKGRSKFSWRSGSSVPGD